MNDSDRASAHLVKTDMAGHLMLVSPETMALMKHTRGDDVPPVFVA